MAQSENQAVKSARERLLEDMRNRYPERDFTPKTDGTSENDESVLEESVLETLASLQGDIDKGREMDDKLNKLFFSDPRSGEFITLWMQSGDPRAALVSVFGDELSELATEEGRSQFSENLKGWRDRKAEADKLNAEAETNWNNTLEALDAWGNKKGLDDKQKAEIAVKLVTITANGLVNKYGTDDFDMAWKAMNYDESVANARREGEVAGRNAKIDENKKRRQQSGMMPPAVLGGQGIPVRPPKEEEKTVWSGIK